jgi:hypothetical protein
VAASNTKSLRSIGFLTMVHESERGFIGGYLVLNELARPLEFHCTAPVKPSRAQEILYGPTLADYLCGEQIAQALVKKSPLEPLAICTDFPPAMSLRAFVPMPVALVVSNEESPGATGEPSSAHQCCPEPTHSTGDLQTGHQWHPKHSALHGPHFARLNRLQLGQQSLAIHESFPRDRDELLARCEAFAARFDLSEPFERIREAIAETQLRAH